jgi:phage terminase large subunit GpA-like protein
VEKVKLAFKPPERLLISQWAAQNITISSGNNNGMKYDPSYMPYQNEFLDVIADPTIDKICIEASSRIGKTFCVSTILAYFCTHDPASVLYVRPTDSDIQKYSKEELSALIQTTPGLRQAIDPGKETYDHKIFPGGSLRLIGSNSAGKLAGYGVRICLMDETSKYAPIPGFGNPEDLAEERTAEYALFGRKIVYISTPTVKDENIDLLYETKSDKRIYVVPCIHCGFEQELKFENVRFDHCRESLDSIYYECSNPACKGHINDSQRLTMMRKGHWLCTRPERTGFAGFRINRLYSPMATMESIVKDFLNKKDDYLKLRQFVNECLGEAWDENKENRASTNQLYNRREHYTAQVPRGVSFLTCAIDVQGNPDADKSWLEYVVMGWGKDNESWVIEHDLIYGSPAEPEIWQEMMTRINKQYTTWAGTLMGITRTGIDTQGGYSKEVHEFIKGKQPKVIGIEGKKNKPGAPLFSKRRNRKINSWEVGTDTAKDTIFSILSIDKPGPNCCHFPDTLDEEYFLSLLSEKKVEKLIGGVKIKKYYQTRARNEVLDITVYNWYLYNHVKKYRPSLLEEGLKALDDAGKPVLTQVVDVVHLKEAPAQPIQTPPVTVPTPPKPPELTAREKYLQGLKAWKAGFQPR